MANPKLIKKRVNSIKGINKMTKALEMVAASKVQHAQDRAVSAKPYARTIYEMISAVADHDAAKEIPIMQKHDNGNYNIFLLLTTNRGLAGNLNNNLLKNLEKSLTEKSLYNKFITIGKKGRRFAIEKGELLADYSDYGDISELSASLAKTIIDEYKNSDCAAVYVVYNDFVTVLRQDPKIKVLLPISKEMLVEEVDVDIMDSLQLNKENNKTTGKAGFNYEPSSFEVLKELLPYYLEIQIAESVYEAEASEHSARMIAMKSASDNASELTNSLSLEYNKARQSMITSELVDITTAQLTIEK